MGCSKLKVVIAIVCVCVCCCNLWSLHSDSQSMACSQVFQRSEYCSQVLGLMQLTESLDSLPNLLEMVSFRRFLFKSTKTSFLLAFGYNKFNTVPKN
jgi:hypothetical protein